MSISVKYWRLPEEELDLARYLESLEPTLVFAGQVYPRREDIRWVSVEEGFRSPASRLLITPARFVDLVRISWVERLSEEGYTVDHTKSPVLFYRRGGLTDNQLSSTALTVESSYLADDGKTSLDHPADFVRWTKKVMQWVRKASPGWYQHKAHRITPKAEAARQAGLELES